MIRGNPLTIQIEPSELLLLDADSVQIRHHHGHVVEGEMAGTDEQGDVVLQASSRGRSLETPVQGCPLIVQVQNLVFDCKN